MFLQNILLEIHFTYNLQVYQLKKKKKFTKDALNILSIYNIQFIYNILAIIFFQQIAQFNN